MLNFATATKAVPLFMIKNYGVLSIFVYLVLSNYAYPRSYYLRDAIWSQPAGTLVDLQPLARSATA